MYLQISQHLQSTVDDESIKLVVITGVGKYFTGGADLTEMLSVEREAEPNFDHFKLVLREEHEVGMLLLKLENDVPVERA